MTSFGIVSHTAFVPVPHGYRCCSKASRTTKTTKAPCLLADKFAATAIAEAAPLTGSATTTTFEPVLNVPAFGAFFFIATIFGFLQYRIAAIGKAAEKRREALTNIRQVKAMELAGENVSSQEIENAKEDYRTALEEVERLRTIIPGIARIAPPPSESENRQRMEENVAAAKQFLDIDISSTLPPQEEEREPRGLSPLLVGVLGVVGFSQIALLLLFVFGPQSSAPDF